MNTQAFSLAFKLIKKCIWFLHMWDEVNFNLGGLSPFQSCKNSVHNLYITLWWNVKSCCKDLFIHSRLACSFKPDYPILKTSNEWIMMLRWFLTSFHNDASTKLHPSKKKTWWLGLQLAHSHQGSGTLSIAKYSWRIYTLQKASHCI